MNADGLKDQDKETHEKGFVYNLRKSATSADKLFDEW
jgi:hypothetical protein